MRKSRGWRAWRKRDEDARGRRENSTNNSWTSMKDSKVTYYWTYYLDPCTHWAEWLRNRVFGPHSSIRSLPHFRAGRKEVFVHDMNVSISDTFNPSHYGSEQEYRRKYWATHSSIPSFAHATYSFACSALQALLARSAELICLLACWLTHSRACGKVNDSMSQNDLVLSQSESCQF